MLNALHVSPMAGLHFSRHRTWSPWRCRPARGDARRRTWRGEARYKLTPAASTSRKVRIVGGYCSQPATRACKSVSSEAGEESTHIGVISLLSTSTCDDRRCDLWRTKRERSRLYHPVYLIHMIILITCLRDPKSLLKFKI
jgi:hypothetical protein